MSSPTFTAPPPTQPEKNWKTWLRGPGVLIGVALIVAFILVAGVFWDEAPVDDSSLRLTYQDIPKKENGYYIFLKIWATMQIKPDEIKQQSRWFNDHQTTWDRALTSATIKPLLAKNQTALSTVRQFLATPKNQLPSDFFPDKIVSAQFPIGDSILVPHLLQFYQAIDLKQSGQDDAAFQKLFDLLKYSQKIQQYDIEALPLSIGLYCQQVTLREMQLMLNASTLSSEQLKDYIRRLETFSPDRTHIANLYRSMHMRNFLIFPKQFDVFPPKGSENVSFMMLPYLYQPNRTKNLEITFFQTLIDNTFLPKTQWATLPVIDPPAKFPELLGPNLLGKQILQASIPHGASLMELLIIMDAQLRLVQTQMALMAYKQEHGSIPPTLNELVPGYLSHLPIDPFDGKPLRYEPAQKKLYSIGKDMLTPTGLSDPKIKVRTLEKLVFPLTF